MAVPYSIIENFFDLIWKPLICPEIQKFADTISGMDFSWRLDSLSLKIYLDFFKPDKEKKGREIYLYSRQRAIWVEKFGVGEGTRIFELIESLKKYPDPIFFSVETNDYRIAFAITV